MKSADSQGKEAKNSLNETLINFYETRLEEIKQSYENQLDEQKKQVEYFKNLYEEEKIIRDFSSTHGVRPGSYGLRAARRAERGCNRF